MVYGNIPRGPLTLLKEVWANEIEIPDNIGMKPLDYLKKLKESLR